MKPSQKKLYDWYKKHTKKFDNIETINKLDTGEIEIITKKEYYIIGKRGGLTQKFNNN